MLAAVGTNLVQHASRPLVVGIFGVRPLCSSRHLLDQRHVAPGDREVSERTSKRDVEVPVSSML